MINNLMNDFAQKLATIKEFVKWARPQLGIHGKIKIHLVKVIKSRNGQGTFGSFNPNNNEITVAYKDRHILDVLRSLAHEMVHHHQNLLNKLKDDSGKTGSDIENEANAFAGILLRNWNKDNRSSGE